MGIYRQAFQLVILPIQQLNGPIVNVAQPSLSRLQSDPERYRRYYQKILFLISVTTIPLGIFLSIYAREIVLILLGVKWIDSAPFLRIFAIFLAITPAIGTSTIVLITHGKSKEFLLIAMVQCVVLFILMIIGLQWGAIGIAISHVSTIIILMIPKLYYSFIGTPVSVGQFFKTIKSILIAGLGMIAILCVLPKLFPLTGAFLTLLFGGVIGTFTYLAILLLLPDGRDYMVALYIDVMSSLTRKKFSGDKIKLKIA